MLHWTPPTEIATQPDAAQDDPEAAVAEFIRKKGVTRCPTACVLPTQGLVAAADRAALEVHAVTRDRIRRAKLAARSRSFWEAGLPVPADT